MYIFITYGREGMRGVQVRAIRIAQAFPKNEVLFLNSGDDTWLKNFGYNVTAVDLEKFTDPSKTNLPDDTRCLIFPDLPTNRAGQLAYLLAARKKKIPVVVVDNLYSAAQLDTKPFKNVLAYADKLYLLGLSFLKDKIVDPKITLVPPLINKQDTSAQEAKNMVCTEFGYSPDKPLVLAEVYNREVFEISRQIAEKYPDVQFIFLGSQEEAFANVKPAGTVGSEKIVSLTLAADLVLCKLGYQQVLEVLALGKPLIVLGSERGLQESWLDPRMKAVLPEYTSFTPELTDLFEKLLLNRDFRKTRLMEIENLHNGSFDAVFTISQGIRTASFSEKILPKTVLLALLDNNLAAVKKIMKEKQFVLPVLFSYALGAHAENRRMLQDLKLADVSAETDFPAIRPDFSLIANFSPHSTHSFAQVTPFYEDLYAALKNLLVSADKIIVAGEKTKQYFSELLGMIPSDKLEFMP